MKKQIEQLVAEALRELSIETPFIVEETSTFTHGDYATNVALAAAKVAKKSPKEVAEKIVAHLNEHKSVDIDRVEIAGPGFVNFYLSDAYLAQNVLDIADFPETYGGNASLALKEVLVEYTDPNPFKVFHIGHLMTNAIGESFARLYEWSDAGVRRLNYQGDVGLHVAKAIWGIRKLSKKMPDRNAPLPEITAFLGEAYVQGSDAYEADEVAKKEIQELNKIVLERSDPEVNDLYDWGRAKSLEHFEEIYRKLGTTFDSYFFESEMAPKGVEIVKKHLGTIFEESDGAIVYRGEKHGLHTRVFINSLGLPTYEAKDLALAFSKQDKYSFDQSIIVTATEQNDYFDVVTKALEEIEPSIAAKTKHVGHGMMRFASGKMSSRKGNVVTGESLLADMEALALKKMTGRDYSEDERREIAGMVAVAAIKYVILKQSIGKDILFDKDKALSFEGDSGPYLQYAHTRAQSILKKAGSHSGPTLPDHVGELEHMLARFPDIVERAARDLAPQYLVTYLTELASAFNSFYARTQILDGGADEAYKLTLTKAIAAVLHSGLFLLGIKTPEKM